MSKRHEDFMNRPGIRYGAAVLVVGFALLCHQALARYIPGFRVPFITFYPAVMVVALLGGLGPGLAATAISALGAAVWILPQPGRPLSWSAADTVSLAVFVVMGIFMNVVAELYHRSRRKVAAYEKELALRESREELNRQREWLRVTLTSIGDAVLAADTAGRITFLNPAAEALTGWREEEAAGRPASTVFRIIDETTRKEVEDVVGRVLRDGVVVNLANHTALIKRDGNEVPIEDSAAPIRDGSGALTGVVLVFRDVTGKRRAQEALRESERRVRIKLDSILSPEGDVSQLALGDILDAPAIQSLMEDFYRLAHLPMSILDLEGRVLVGVGWQTVCTKFHRVHPESCENCLLSDTILTAGIRPGESRLYKCKNNLWDMATPIIIGGRHLGNIFTGQFFVEDEPLDYELFRSQARQYGFDEKEYIEALEAVPRVSRTFLEIGTAFLVKLSGMLSQLSYSNVKLARSLAEREALMDSLRKGEERFRQLADAMPHLVWTAGPDGVTDYYNRRCEEFDGFARDADGNWRGEPVLHSDDAGQSARAWRHAVETGSIFQIEHRIRASSGTYRWYLSRGLPVRDEGGRITKWFGTDTDIDDRKRAEQALRESQDDLKRAQAVGQIGSWRLDVRKNELLWSKETHRIFGLPLGTAMTYETFLASVHPEDREHVDLRWKAALRGEPYDIEHRIVLGDQVKWVRERAELEFDAQGAVLGGFGTTQDITAKRNAQEALQRSEEALRQTNELLERKVEERTLELTQRAGQLRALAGELTLAEQRERRRVAKVLHDQLQQLLVGAKFRVSILGRSADDVVRMAACEIEDILAESINASRSLTTELSPPVLQSGGLLPGLDWLARWISAKHDISIELTAGRDLPPLADDVKILVFESVRELLFNSVKHARVRTARVQVRETDGQLRVAVSDEGAGFDPGRLKPAGTSGGGFGLFSIRERIDLIGGTMQIESAPGKGSRFVLTVPARTAPQSPPALPVAPPPEQAVPAPAVVPELPPAPGGIKARVLLTDDHAVMRDGLARLLGKEPDIEIVGQASDGQMAIELARKLHPDVVLMDLSMPKFSGIEATRIIHEELPEVRVIALSIFDDSEHEETMIAAGAAAFLPKSGPSEHIIFAIRACMEELQALRRGTKESPGA